MSNRLLFPFLASLLIISSCAIQVAPTGGAKDVKPPVVKKSSPENFSTQFTGHDISITFDEYITLKELSTQFVVSPPLRHQPDTKVKKKTLSIHLEDTLLKNTTYTMNFGNAITDIREGNAVEGFQYVFSTGDVIDSLKIPGKVENAFDKKTEKGIYIMLYHGTDDSLPLKTLPDYFAKTAEDGSFEVKNVAPGSYKIFALKDNNSNYLFDNSDEPIAFRSEPVEAGKSAGSLSLFKEIRSQQMLKASSDEPGKITVAYAMPLDHSKIVFLSDTAAIQLYATVYSEKRDTITFWYKNIQSDSLNFILERDLVRDTVNIRLKRVEPRFRSRYDGALLTQYKSKTENDLNLQKPLQLFFNHPIDSFDLSKISVKEDSILVKNVKSFFTDSLNRNLTIDFPRKEKTMYTVDIPAKTFRDILELRNDTLELLFHTKSVSDYGTMEIKLQLSSSGNNFIVQLIDDKENVYRQSIVQSDTTINYNYLEPKIYRLKLIEDENNNTIWDPGNYLHHKQPEQVFYYQESLTVRANWDVDVSWGVESSQ